MRHAVTAAVLGAGVGVFQALATILAARVLLLLAMAGGFALALIAMERQTVLSAAIMALYAVLVVFPVAGLEWLRGRPKGGADAA